MWQSYVQSVLRAHLKNNEDFGEGVFAKKTKTASPRRKYLK
jgi:hypothetical protein